MDCVHYKFRLLLLLTFLSAVLIGCGGSSGGSGNGSDSSETRDHSVQIEDMMPDLPGGDFFIVENNSRLLTGPTPNAPADVDPAEVISTAKLIPIKSKISSSPIQFLSASLIKSNNVLNSWKIVVAGKNISDDTVCPYYGLQAIETKDGGLISLADNEKTHPVVSSHYVRSPSGYDANSFSYICFEPGESGYFLIGLPDDFSVEVYSDIKVPFDQVESVHIDALTYYTQNEVPPASEVVVPLNYTLEPHQDFTNVNVVRVNFQNQSDRSLVIDNNGDMLFLDSSGFVVNSIGSLPCDESIASSLQPVTLASGEEFEFCGEIFDHFEWSFVRPIAIWSLQGD